MIRIKNLAKSFGKLQVLKEIDIQFEPGKVHGIVGENGAGKTTFFRCLIGLETHTGSVQAAEKLLSEKTGFLPTEPYFFSKMTGAEYLRLLTNARNIKVEDLEVKNLFELPLNRYVSNYSSGMKKKLAITALLMQQNECFILDEPFNGVDIQSNLIILELIKKLKEQQKIVIVSSHIFSTLYDTCDEISLLKAGSIQQHFLPHEFNDLEKEMKQSTFNNKLDALFS